MIADPITAPVKDTTIPASVTTNAVPVTIAKRDLVVILLNFSDTCRPLCVNSKKDDLMALKWMDQKHIFSAIFVKDQNLYVRV